MKRKLIAMGAGLVILAGLTGCGVSRGSNDMWDSAGEHVEMHVQKFYKQLVGMHSDLDRYFGDIEEDNPDLGYMNEGF